MAYKKSKQEVAMEAYQIIGALAYELDVFDSDEVQNALTYFLNVLDDDCDDIDILPWNINL